MSHRHKAVMFENNKMLKPFILYLGSVGLREVKWERKLWAYYKKNPKIYGKTLWRKWNGLAGSILAQRKSS